VETPLFEGMLAAREIAEEGIAEEQVQTDDAVDAAVQESVTEDVANVAIPSTLTPRILPSPPSHAIPSTSQVQFSPPQQPQSSPQALPQGAEFPTHLFQQVLDTCSALTRRVKNLEHDKAAQKLEIIKLKARVKRLETTNKVKSSKLRHLKKVGTSQRIESFDDMEAADKQVEIYHLDLDHPFKVLSMQEDDSEVQEVVKDKGKGILIETPKPIKKKDQIELDAEYARKLHEEINKDHEEINKDIDWDAAIDHVKQKSKENPQYIKRYQVMKKRPQTESEARKNMMIYLKNTAGYKLDFFKGMSYDEICPIFQASINETPAQKATKRRKLNEEAQEVKDLKKHLEVVNDEDGDVFTEVTPFARKVPVVDYQIVLINNNPRFKIIKADETHQLYISFITLLKNFDKEDLENLWGIVKERFSTLKPRKLSDEYLLTTLKTMFEKPDG
nr:hypothetical protein [Tanacetum cinerariifolium]